MMDFYREGDLSPERYTSYIYIYLYTILTPINQLFYLIKLYNTVLVQCQFNPI